MRQTRYLVPIAATLALSACSGDLQGTATLVTFAELSNEFNALEGDVTIGTNQVDPSTLPMTGSSTYNGVLQIALDPGATSSGNALTLNGDMIVTANFDGDSVDGSVSSFSDSAGDTYSGQLDITNGDIRRDVDPTDEVTFIADIDGDLTNDFAGDDYSVDAFFVGDFYGTNEEFIGGVLRGEITNSVGTLVIRDTGVVDGTGTFIGTQ